MKRFVAVLPGMAFLLAASVSTAAAQCQTISAMDDSVLVPPGPDCPSPIGFCASSDRVQGNHGFRGTFFFSALAFEPIPSDPLGRLAVSGISTFTLRDGTVTISDVSAFDVQAGTFSGVGRITSGTGRFAGATGDVFTAGRAHSSGTAFTTETRLEVCYAP
jgi:hypothetical protein